MLACSPVNAFMPVARLAAALGIALAAGCAAPGDATLAVNGGEPVRYRCAQGGDVVARYYVLSDGSLRFVKLVVDRVAHTLPQSVSGSGARYTDDRDLVWWIKGDAASLQQRDPRGEWQTVRQCTASKGT